MFEKESFYPSAALNCAITDTSVSFDPQLPLGNKAGTSLSCLLYTSDAADE